MALAEALLKATYDALKQESYQLECATEDAWDALWERAHENDHTEGDLQELAEAYGLAKLAEELKREQADVAQMEWHRARPR